MKPTVRRDRRCGGRAAGFTLVELLAVITILVILLAMIAWVTQYTSRKSAEKETLCTQLIVMDIVKVYKDATGGYPTGNGNARTLMSTLAGDLTCRRKLGNVASEAWSGSGSALKDGWGRDMVYQSAGGFGATPVLISGGSNGSIGDDDDVRSDRS